MNNIYEIKKSKFIALKYTINSKDDVKKIIDDLWKEHKKARHICYAFEFRDQEGIMQYGMSDDGEPKGTAGKVIFNLIQLHKQSNILVVVVRYFGGIKLGSGPLLRAYSTAANLVFKL
ncbi:YigZ family protein [Mycoplasma procyoni]|uniref:YigZ family protein n=1 Tax=Mycoplasma procyoni TaxID=568784 RepID=UPI00197C0279|nr:YigZ family protein [Mycoplasma procyoni]MBN3535038.1 YigZ family protein [Mycoplasma procyoni]